MADLRPLRGLRFNVAEVDFGAALSPPYDVIGTAAQEELYGRDLRNIVRIDYGADYGGDQPGLHDRYTRAADHLAAWLRLGILRQDQRPALYVTRHAFPMPDGSAQTRIGLLGRVPATVWERSDLRPHERTLRGPKQDRLALMRATRTQTSPVFAVWQGAAELAPLLHEVRSASPAASGVSPGELGDEEHTLWLVDDPEAVRQMRAALAGARLYVADGHHRYETAAAYAAERRREQPEAPTDADFEFCLVYLCAADEPGMVILPTHRMVRPGRGRAFSLDDLWVRLDDAWEADPAPDVEAALHRAELLRASHHAFAVVGHDGVAVLSRPRRHQGSPRQRLDVTVLEEEVLAPAGADGEAIAAGALAYTREAGELSRAVASGEALLGFGLLPATVAEMIAVADAREVMPQKSTYFYPKVPTGLVLSPL